MGNESPSENDTQNQQLTFSFHFFLVSSVFENPKKRLLVIKSRLFISSSTLDQTQTFCTPNPAR